MCTKNYISLFFYSCPRCCDFAFRFNRELTNCITEINIVFSIIWSTPNPIRLTVRIFENIPHCTCTASPDSTTEFLINLQFIFPIAIIKIYLFPPIVSVCYRFSCLTFPPFFTRTDVVWFIIKDDVSEESASTLSTRFSIVNINCD